jgi:hypothetical protein
MHDIASAGPVTGKEFVRKVRKGRFDFLDFGCSRGGSIKWARKTFSGIKGLGIDIDERKVAGAREAGHEAIRFDILEIPRRKLVRFTVMRHFLEHVPDRGLARKFIARACAVSSDFIVIQQPYFDADGFLMREGLKLYWSDWNGHPFNMTSLDLYRFLRQLEASGKIAAFSIHAKTPIGNSTDPAIHPLSSPCNQHAYDPTIHPAKRGVAFDFPVFEETIALAWMVPGMGADLARRVKPDQTMFASDA